MSNLENLIEKIKEDAENEAKSILEAVNKEKNALVKKKELEAEKKKVEIIEKAEFDNNLLRERIISKSEIDSRYILLEEKQKIIKRVFTLAKENLGNLDKKEYSNYLKSKIDSLDLKGTETLIVQENMRDEILKLNLPYDISKDEFVEAGFLVKDEDIYINYKFNDLVDFYKEDLLNDVAAKLFER